MRSDRIPSATCEKRLDRVRGYLAERSMEALIVQNSSNIFYLTGLLEIEGILLIRESSTILFLPALYYGEALDNLSLKSVDLRLYTRTNLSKSLTSLSRAFFLKNETPYPPAGSWAAEYGLELEESPDFIGELRVVKDAGEISLIRKARSVGKEVLSRLESGLIFSGMTESEMAGHIHCLIAECGGRKAAFDPIVASGVHSSYPHHKNRPEKIQQGRPLVVDMGVDYAGYKSDMTATFFPGGIDEEFRNLFRVVREVYEKSVEDSLKGDGLTGADIHARAVNIFKKHKLEEFFIHGLGHGVGIDVHERPAINPSGTESLQEGNVFTIEPGIYIPGKGGIRIEDTFIL